jgi:hypothetical protein
MRYPSSLKRGRGEFLEVKGGILFPPSLYPSYIIYKRISTP